MSKEKDEAYLVRRLMDVVREAQDYERRTGRKLGASIKGELTPREELFLELSTSVVYRLDVRYNRDVHQHPDGSLTGIATRPPEIQLTLMGLSDRATVLLQELMQEPGEFGSVSMRA